MSTVKIIVLCGGPFAFPSIQLLAFEKYLAGIVVASNDRTCKAALKEACSQGDLPYLALDNKKQLSELANWIKDISPTAIFSICFPYLLPTHLLALLPNRFINFHTGPLPEYRGANPIFEVLRSLETKTALTVHLMNEYFDEGPIVMEEEIALEEGETYGSLSIKLSDRTAMASLNMAQMLEYGTQLPTREQTQENACYHPQPETRDTFIDWENMHAKEIEALINACNPWNMGADTRLAGRMVKIISAKYSELPHEQEPGTVISLDERGYLHIACIESERLLVDILHTEKGICSARHFAERKTTMDIRFH